MNSFLNPHLSIESGVALASTCSFFWNNERIQNWIREKEKQVFGSNISKSVWNKLADYVDLPTGSIRFFCENYLALYVRTSYFVSKYVSMYENETSIFGVFSSKERLFLTLKTALNLGYTTKHCDIRYESWNGFFIVTVYEPERRLDKFYVPDAIVEDFKLLFVLRYRNGEGL